MKFASLLISMIAWAAAVEAQAPSASGGEKLAADKEITTSGGATFTAPGGWSMVTSGPLIVLEPPEADSHVVIFDSDAATADAAIDAAWAAYKRGEKRPIRQKLSPTAREGWEEVQVYLYETSPNERAVVQAVARRAKNAWTVVILDGKQPTFEKRGAAAGPDHGEPAAGRVPARILRGTQGRGAECRAPRADERVRRDGHEEARHPRRRRGLHR